MSYLREQGMAQSALSALPTTVTAKLRTRYRTLRVMIHLSGLAATYAFVASKAAKSGSEESEAYKEVRSQIAARLFSIGAVSEENQDARSTMRALAEMPTETYLRASADIESLFSWLARLADAMVTEDDDPEDDHA